MDIKGKVVIVAGGASGIGKALCERFVQQGARGVVVADLEGVGAVTPEAVAAAVLNAMRDGRFLVLPHPEVLTFQQRKAADRGRWIRGMRRLREQVVGTIARQP